jgi:hypothetical protein
MFYFTTHKVTPVVHGCSFNRSVQLMTGCPAWLFGKCPSRFPDIRQVFCRPVLTGEGHSGKVYELAGDETYTMSDLAAVLSDVSGKPVQYMNLPAGEYEAALVKAGLGINIKRKFYYFLTRKCPEKTGYPKMRMSNFTSPSPLCPCTSVSLVVIIKPRSFGYKYFLYQALANHPIPIFPLLLQELLFIHILCSKNLLTVGLTHSVVLCETSVSLCLTNNYTEGLRDFTEGTQRKNYYYGTEQDY